MQEGHWRIVALCAALLVARAAAAAPASIDYRPVPPHLPSRGASSPRVPRRAFGLYERHEPVSLGLLGPLLCECLQYRESVAQVQGGSEQVNA